MPHQIVLPDIGEGVVEAEIIRWFVKPGDPVEEDQPLDIDAIAGSVRKTGRAVVVHEAPRTCGFGAEISALIQERCFLQLEAPVTRVTGFDTPFPYTLESEYLPRAPRILKAIREAVAF